MGNFQLFLIVVAIVAAYLVYRILVLYQKNKLKYVFTPFTKNFVRKYLGQEWDIDTYNHVMRPLPRGQDVVSTSALLGAIRINSWNKLYRIRIDKDATTPVILDLYSYDPINKTLVDLVFSVANPRDITLGTGEFMLREDFYVPLLRVGGELSKAWLRSVDIIGPMPKCVKREQRYSNVIVGDYGDTLRGGGESVPKFFELSLTPKSFLIKRSGINYKAIAGNKITLHYCSRVKNSFGSVLVANAIGSRVEEIHGPETDEPTLCKKVWDIGVDREVNIAETVYALSGDYYEKPYLVVE